ncbi:phosphotransferase [Exiguobacterium sp. TDN 0502]|uniref:phosphotransferase n=1 Tax=Exiguobacterium sp. TDN 0502 TaxID=3420731 RepID=UPI003D786A07
MNNEQMNTLCQAFQIGTYRQDVRQVSGGLMHELFTFSTDTGRYAVKRLNQHIMKRADAYLNFQYAEDVAHAAAEEIPALPALRNNGPLYQMEGTYYLLFPWIVGNTLAPEEIQPAHAETIGNVLAALHQLSLDKSHFKKPSTSYDKVDWTAYIRQGRIHNLLWLEQLQTDERRLRMMEENLCRSLKKLGNEHVVSHRDLDPKNVLWTTNGPVLIDWESAGLIHRAVDLFETACYWSNLGNDAFDRDRFSAFLYGYQTEQSLPVVDWIYVIDSSVQGKLDWLTFNLDRSLGKHGIPEAEQTLGTEQVIQTLAELK